MNELQKHYISSVGDGTSDELLVSAANEAMSLRLKSQAEGGFSGWLTTRPINDDLYRRLIRNAEKGDMVDVMNLAAMIYVRTELYGDDA